MSEEKIRERAKLYLESNVGNFVKWEDQDIAYNGETLIDLMVGFSNDNRDNQSAEGLSLKEKERVVTLMANNLTVDEINELSGLLNKERDSITQPLKDEVELWKERKKIWVGSVRILEKELNSANDKIKELTELGHEEFCSNQELKEKIKELKEMIVKYKSYVPKDEQPEIEELLETLKP